MIQRVWAPALLAGLWVPALAAQPPAAVPPAPVGVAAFAASPVLLAPAAPGCPCPGPFAPDLMLGQQTGLRGQLAVLDTPGETWVGEAFYGGLFTRIRHDEAVGLGGRYLWHRCCACDSRLDIGPGVNVFYQWAGEGQW